MMPTERNAKASQDEEKNGGAPVQFAFLAGGSEMAERIKAHDWTRSPLGAMEFWPAALLSTLSICLSARFPMAIYWGAEGFLLYNDAWRPILGNKHPWALGRSAREVWPEIWATIGPLFETVRSTGQATWRQDELLPMHRFGYLEECYFDYSFNPITGQSKTIEGILNVVQETTFRVLNERRTRLLSELASRSVLAKTEQQAWQFSVEAIATDPLDVPSAILCATEPDGSFRIVASTGLSGDVPAKFENGDAQLLAGLTPHSKPVVVEKFGEQLSYVAGGRWPEPVTQTVLLPIVMPSESRVAAILIVGVSPRRQLDEPYSRFLELIASHVASILANAKTIEEERKRAQALAELDHAKTTFFSNVSHELRTPLTLILGPLEDELRERKGQSDRLELAHRNSLRLLKLVNTLLDFSRIEAGRVEPSFVPTDLAAFTEELGGVFRSSVERAGLSLSVSCPPLPEPVYVDRDMWEKIVFNLLSNALKFTLKGSIEIELGVESKPAAVTQDSAGERLAIPCVCLTVRDTGTGIPAAELPRIFERFQRVRNPHARSHEGTGIGLALVRELARLHGGCAGVKSVEGNGTTFTVWIPLGVAHLPKNRIGTSRALGSTHASALPFVEEAERWLPENQSPNNFSNGESLGQPLKVEQEPEGKNGPRKGARILLADDNTDMRNYVRRLLEARGHDVKAVENGEAALAAIRAEPPALVLSDVMMPRLDGFGLLRALRGDPKTSAIPIILISARAGEESRAEGVEAGADDYLTKPFSARELIARVTTHLDLTRIRREAEAKIRDTLDSIADGLHVVDAAERITYLNAAARRTMAENNIDPDHLIGRAFFDVFPETLKVEVGRAMRQTMMARVPTTAESFYEPWQRWYGVRHYPTADGGVSTFFQDITERKRSEEMLRQNEALFSSLVHLAPTGVYVVDAEFRLQQINPRALPAFEKVENAIGRDFAEVMGILWGPEVGGEIVKIFRHTLATGERYISERFSNIRQDLGVEKTYEWETRRMTLPDGRHGVVCYFNDITESVRAEQALQEAKAAAERANRSKDHFLAALSHELRTPLTPVLMTAATLREDERLPAEVREQLGMMERNIALEGRLIDDLLDISAIATGKMQLHRQMSDTHSLIRLAVEIVRDAALTKEIKIACELKALHCGLITDPARFQQVIWNLLRNAVKFTPRGGSVFIRTSDQEDRRLRIEITDTGIGIGPDALEKIFLPFEQAAVAGDHRFGGLGLGLAIARSIVGLHGGTISAQSAGTGRGATFIAEFPGAKLLFSGAASMTSPATASAPPSGRTVTRSLRLLLVEDHLPTLQVLTHLLTRDGHVVVAVGTISAALATAAAETFDLVISDLGLPDGTGDQMMEKLSTVHGLKGIALTGYGMDEDVLRSRKAGFVTHLVKPVHMAELRRALGQLS